MQKFRNKFEKYKDGKKSIYFSIFFGEIFLKHKDIFKKILNPIIISIVLCSLLFAIFFQKQIFLYSFLYSIITILKVICLIICSAVVAKLFFIKVFRNIVAFLIILSCFNLAILFVSYLLAQKLFLIFYKISWSLLSLFILYKVFSFVLPSLKNGVVFFLKKTVEVNNLFNLYCIIIFLTNIFYMIFVCTLLVLIKGSATENINIHLLNTLKKLYFLDSLNTFNVLSIIANHTYFLIAMDLILILIAKLFRMLISLKVLNDNPSLFKYYEDNFNIITDTKFEKILNIFAKKTKNIRKVFVILLIVVGFKVLLAYFIV